MRHHIFQFDGRLIGGCRAWAVPAARTAIALIYVWFGALKVFGLSPAEPLVRALFARTIPLFTFETFLLLFALFEVAIGLLFLVRGLERLAILFLAIHLVMTALPLVLLPAMTWIGWFVPTMTGQYIIKNILIVALAMVIGSGMVPMRPVEAKPRAAC